MKPYRLYKGAWLGVDESKEVLLSSVECDELLRQGGFFVRNVYDFDAVENSSFWFVIKDNFGGLEELTASARRDVRKSLRCYDIEPISADRLRAEGYRIFADAQQTYKVKCDVVSREAFDALINRYIAEGDKEFWGAISKDSGALVAVAICTIKQRSCEYSTLKCLPSALKDGSQPYYGLIYRMNEYYLSERGMRYVNDGARSLTNHSNIQPFLIQKFKFRKAYCRVNVVYKWYIGLLVKLLYPFRSWILLSKAKSLLTMEAIARGDI